MDEYIHYIRSEVLFAINCDFLLCSKLQELRGNIRVFSRCRYDDETDCCLQFPSDREVLPPGAKKGMKFDKVFTPRSTQDEVKNSFTITESCSNY